MIRIATWNIAALPSIINPLRCPEKHLDSILNTFNELEPDFLCLQEVFCLKIRRLIIDNLNNKGYNTHYSRDDNLISKNGLLNASKFDIKDKLEVDYKNFTGPEYLIKKGMISTQYSIPSLSHGINNIVIHNTHLQSDSLGPIKNICSHTREKQHKDIYEYLELFDNLDKPSTLHALCGDINDDFEKIRLRKFVKKLPFQTKIKNSEKIITFNALEDQLDYIIINKNINVKYSIVNMDNHLNISDHNILIADLALKN